MPRFDENSFSSGGERWHPVPILAPLPGPAVVIDVRRNNDLQLLQYLKTEIEDLAREMRLNQVDQWRFLAQCIDFLQIDILAPDPIPNASTNFVIRNIEGQAWAMPGKQDLAHFLGKNFFNAVRNSRIKAANDDSMQTITISPEQSTVRVFFLTDLDEEESLKRATIYAHWLKAWCNDDSGPARAGRNEHIEVVIIGMNAVPHRHYSLLTDSDTLFAVDTVILLQTYRDDDGYIDEEAQIYQTELLLYTLLLHWPEGLSRVIDDSLADALDGKQTLPKPTYIVGISAYEYSARWGTRWLDYGLAAKILELLRDGEEVQREGKQLQFEVESWWKGWWERIQTIISSLSTTLPYLEGLDLAQRFTQPSHVQYKSPDALLQSMAEFGQRVTRLYNSPGGATLQLALDSASLIPSQLEQGHKQAVRNEIDQSPVSEIYHLLSELQTQAQLFLLPLFHKARGVVPRAINQLAALNIYAAELRQLTQNPPDVQQFRSEFEREAQQGQKRLERLLEELRWRPWTRGTLLRERESIQRELGAILNKHFVSIRAAIAAHLALTLLQRAGLYDMSGQPGLYQKRLERFDKELKAAQERALYQQTLAKERLKYSLSEAAQTSNWRNLNNRKDLLQWNMITDSFLRSCDELESDSSQLNLLAEMLLRRLGTQKVGLNGQNSGNDPYSIKYPQQGKDEEYFQVISTALVSILLTVKIGNAEVNEIFPLLDHYSKIKHLYLLEPSVLDSDVLDVRDIVKEVMLEQVIYGNSTASLATKRDLSTEFILSAWVASQHKTNSRLAKALDSRSIITYVEEESDNSSRMFKELGKQNRLDGYPDKRVGDDHYYLLLPTGEAQDIFLKEFDFTQAAQIHAVAFPDMEKLIYLHVHRLRQI